MVIVYSSGLPYSNGCWMFHPITTGDNDTLDSNVSTSACHHTVAVVKGQESYELYKTSFKNVFVFIN